MIVVVYIFGMSSKITAVPQKAENNDVPLVVGNEVPLAEAPSRETQFPLQKEERQENIDTIHESIINADNVPYETYLNIGLSLASRESREPEVPLAVGSQESSIPLAVGSQESSIPLEIIHELEKVKALLENNNDKMSVQLKIDHIKATHLNQ